MNAKQNKKVFLKQLLIFLLFIAFFIPLLPKAHAQLTRAARIELNDADKHVYIGENSYVIQDSDNILSYEALANRHQNSLRGQSQSKNIIYLGQNSKQVWILFSVTNNTDDEDWVLDFGSLTDGRSAVSKAIVTYDQTDSDSLDATSGKQSVLDGILNNRAVYLNLPRGKTQLVALKVLPQTVLANTVAPYLISANHYFEQPVWRKNLVPFIILLFFMLMIGAFITLSYIRQNFTYLGFSVFYALNALLFYNLNITFTPILEFWRQIWVVAFLANGLVGLCIAHVFLRIRSYDRNENITLIGAGLVTILAGLIYIFLPENSSYRYIALYGPLSISALVIAVLSFMRAQEGHYAGMHFSASWSVAFLGIVISGLCAFEILPTNIFLLNAYWVSLLPQAILFITSIRRRITMLEEEELHKRSRESREVQSRARLKHSKESADQARLLRVIERERELMAELREREMQRTEEMRIAKETAVDANRAKSAFLAVVSHEIRTPMTGILGILRLLGDTTLNKEQLEYVLSIQSSGETMMALLNDILDFEKIERGAMDLEEISFDLAKLVHGVVTLMSGHAADKNLNLSAEISKNFPHAVKGDPTRIRQILLNLVSNAVKFTQRGGVVIHLRASPVDVIEGNANADYEVYIGVKDTGIGISEEAQHKLFSPFEQADNTVARRFGGTGLGLAICKRLVEAMGGAISIKSEEGDGSLFYFNILMSPGNEQELYEHKTNASYVLDIPLMRLLVIEDNEINSRVLRGFLEKGGHKVVVTDSGEGALKILETQNFDAIFTDINLKEMDGIETSRAIRALPDAIKAKTPLVAISGNVSDENIEHYKAAGIDDFIAKPIVPETLYSALKAISMQGDTADGEMETPQLEKTDQAGRTISGEINIDNDIFEPSIIENLISSLGLDQFQGLMVGYLEKADELVEDLNALQNSDEVEEIRARAHEFKGMAANFGVKDVSAIAGIIEDAAQIGDIQAAQEAIKKLPDANRRAKDAITNLS